MGQVWGVDTAVSEREVAWSNIDIAAKRRKKHKSQISLLIFSIGYQVKIREFRLFTRPSIFIIFIFLQCIDYAGNIFIGFA